MTCDRIICRATEFRVLMRVHTDTNNNCFHFSPLHRACNQQKTLQKYFVPNNSMSNCFLASLRGRISTCAPHVTMHHNSHTQHAQASHYLHSTVSAAPDHRPLQPRGIRRLQHSALSIRHAFKPGRVYLQISSSVSHIGGRKPVQRNAPLMIGLPGRCAMNGSLTPHNNITCSGDGLVPERVQRLVQKNGSKD